MSKEEKAKKIKTVNPIQKPIGKVKNLNTETRGVFEYKGDKNSRNNNKTS